MQRRHFEALAEAVREARKACPYDEASELRQEGYELALETIAKELATVCRRFDGSQGFKRDFFLEACRNPEARNRSPRRNSPA